MINDTNTYLNEGSLSELNFGRGKKPTFYRFKNHWKLNARYEGINSSRISRKAVKDSIKSPAAGESKMRVEKNDLLFKTGINGMKEALIMPLMKGRQKYSL